MKKIINTNEAPKAIGPYSQAVESNGMLFISGQVPINPETGKIVEKIVGRRLRSETIKSGRIPKTLTGR